MKILVIDDNAVNRNAAKLTLTGHDLTVVSNWDEAVELLEVRYDEAAIETKLVAAGLPPTPDPLRPKHNGVWTEWERKVWSNWCDAYDQVRLTCKVPYWDAVLCDLLMPASSERMGKEGMKYVGLEMPLGIALALLAAKNGAKYVAVVTATNHHHHPASAMLDRLGSAYWENECKPNFVINGAQAMFVHHPSYFVEGVPCPKCNGAKYTAEGCGWCSIDDVPTGQEVDWDKRAPIAGTVCKKCDGTKKDPCSNCAKTGNAEAKHWGKVLSRLLDEPVADEKSHA